MTPTIKELVELNHSDARLLAKLRANAKRRCQLMQQGIQVAAASVKLVGA